MSNTREKNGPWTITARERVYRNPWIEIIHHEVVHPSGDPGIYGVVRFHNRAVGVLPIDETGHVWLVGQHRFPFDRYSWELPEGGVPEGEDPLAGARRELAEETGLQAAGWMELTRFDISNSVTDERAICFLAHDLSPAPEADRHADPSEDLSLRKVHFQALLEAVLAGEITDSLTIMMVLMARERALRGDLPAAISGHVCNQEAARP